MRSWLVTLCFVLTLTASAQELDIRFSLNSSQIQGTNKQVFETLEKSIVDFLNNRVWTNHIYESHERIECNMLLTIDKYESDIMKGSLQIQSRRPVYNSSYNSVMFNYMDEDIEFKYVEFDPIEFSENSYISNLSSLLAFYTYIILGLDYDSFSKMGGNPYFELADKIVLNANNSGRLGWRGSDDKKRKNRYWLINNILDKDYAPVREFSYNYHRLGLDIMEKSSFKGKQVILQELERFKRIQENKPDPFMHFYEVIRDSKSDEIVQMFSGASREEKQKVLEIMKVVDPSGINKYEALQN
ncbi:MAG: DUF4835 family protein [Bacteroidales bacterium]|nr:DUF4835 family protein [Bacteroidales bacterium]